MLTFNHISRSGHANVYMYGDLCCVSKFCEFRAHYAVLSAYSLCEVAGGSVNSKLFAWQLHEIEP